MQKRQQFISRLAAAIMVGLWMLFATAAFSHAETPEPTTTPEQSAVVISAPLDSATPTGTPTPTAPTGTPTPVTEDPADDYDDTDDSDVPTNDQSTLYVILAAAGVALIAALFVLIKK